MPKNEIKLSSGADIIRVDSEGFRYNDQFIRDGGEAHRLLIGFLRTAQPEADWQHAANLKSQALGALGRFSANAHTTADEMMADFELLRQAVLQLPD
jgi:hypothetical protein